MVWWHPVTSLLSFLAIWIDLCRINPIDFSIPTVSIHVNQTKTLDPNLPLTSLGCDMQHIIMWSPKQQTYKEVGHGQLNLYFLSFLINDSDWCKQSFWNSIPMLMDSSLHTGTHCDIASRPYTLCHSATPLPKQKQMQLDVGNEPNPLGNKVKPQKMSAFSRQSITRIANLIYTCFI